MSVSRNFVDVSSGPQGVIFDVDFDDASGIESIFGTSEGSKSQMDQSTMKLFTGNLMN